MTLSSRAPGILEKSLSEWLPANIPGAIAPFSFHLIAGGESNLTYHVTDQASNQYVLRRPPEGVLQATAHDVVREARIMDRLQTSAVPVPAVRGICDDRSVTGAQFFVMEYVSGHVLRTATDMNKMLSAEVHRQACESLIETMATIHSVDLQATGLADLARRDGYLERQLRRWKSQWDSAGAPENKLIEELHDRLSRSIPVGGDGSALVHGDFRFDNALVDDHGRVMAVVDWELATLGDPYADLGITLAAWSEPGEMMSFGVPGPTSASRCLTRREAIDCYSRASGRPVQSIEWYIAWAHWRIACILGGVYGRSVRGAGHGQYKPSDYSDEISRQGYFADEWLRAIA